MAGGVHVEHEALATQAQAFHASHGELVAILTRIRGQIQDLTSSGFVTDSASGSFAEASERWNTAATTCVDELQTMRDYLNRTSTAFADADQAMTVRM
ncbi:MAG: WXG100 family type VII secretion target [Kineosporiaceae bacterium]